MADMDSILEHRNNVIEKIYNSRGYLVIGYWSEDKIGEIFVTVHGETFIHPLRQPFRVIAPTSFEDWEQQRRLFEANGVSTAKNGEQGYYFRAVTE